MNENEVKQSFSLKYFLLITITTVIMYGIGLAISRFSDSRPIKEITVANGNLINLINDLYLLEEQYGVKYYLKDETRTKISSLFWKKVIIENSGNKGVSDLSVTVILRGNDIKLGEFPNIKTVPSKVIDTIAVKKDYVSTDDKHLWTVSLLNPGESITFEYSAFSKKKIDSISLYIIPRKRDWKIKYENLTFSYEASLNDYLNNKHDVLEMVTPLNSDEVFDAILDYLILNHKSFSKKD